MAKEGFLVPRTLILITESNMIPLVCTPVISRPEVGLFIKLIEEYS